MKILFTITILALFASQNVSADVEIQMQDPEGSITTFWIGGEKVKMANQSANGYVIVDVSQQKQFLVDHFEKMVIDVTDGFGDKPMKATPNQQTSSHDISIEKVGSGPSIAGFSSEQYEVKANGTLCSTEYLSTEPFKHPEIVKLLKVMALLSESEDMGNNALYNPCEQAELYLEKQYQAYGVPMRSVSADGVVISQVTEFNIKDAPAGTYEFPSGYKLTTMRALLQEQIAPPGHPAP